MENPIVDDGGLSDRYAPHALSLLRIITAILFLLHGTSKILMFPMSSASGPAVWTLLWIAGMIELVGGLALLLGIFSRPVALLLCGEMAIGYFMVHAPKDIYPMLNGGEAAILFCFIFLYIAFEGPGPLSIDRWWHQRRHGDGPDGYLGLQSKG
ncbi:MAG: DoxX family protein [Sphingomicrobium sp.]